MSERVLRCTAGLSSLFLFFWLTTNPVPATRNDASSSADPIQAPSLDDGSPRADKTAGRILLQGPDARKQVLITAHSQSGRPRDYTHRGQYRTRPTGIVEVDATGFLTPLGNGSTSLQVQSPEGLMIARRVVVQGVDQAKRVNFPNQVVPLFTKNRCHSGGCHGKASGQNGFRLSLLEFEPREDYEHVVMEGRGRRLFPKVPERSLFLVKATGQVPHGGGSRISPSSSEYELLYRWVEQKMPYGEPSDPQVHRLEVFPAERLLDRSGQQQLMVTAHYTDGSSRDVTRLVQYESKDLQAAEVGSTGWVEVGDVAGDFSVMVRFQDQVAVFQGTVPLGIPTGDFLQPKKLY